MTHVGVLELVSAGLRLRAAMPGIDPVRDVVDFSEGRVTIRREREVPVVPRAVVTGSGRYLESMAPLLRHSP